VNFDRLKDRRNKRLLVLFVYKKYKKTEMILSGISEINLRNSPENKVKQKRLLKTNIKKHKPKAFFWAIGRSPI